MTNDPKEPGKYGADIAASPLVITAAREEVIDFVKPFAHLGLTVLLKRPDLKNNSIDWPYDFDVVKPLSAEVWLTCVVSMIVVSTGFRNRCPSYL